VTRCAAGIAGGVLLAQAFAAQAPQPPTVPMFKSGTVDVVVPVTVLSRNVPVLDLTVADFDIMDNGVRQRVRELDPRTLPVDVTLIVDTSGSTAGILDRLAREAGNILADLHPTDRYRVMTINSFVTEVMPMQAVSAVPLFHPPAGGGMSAVYDALAAALMHPAMLDRRHVVAAMTDGIDTISTIGLARLREVAKRSEAVLHVLLVAPSSPSNRSNLLLPHVERDLAGLAEVAALTGGRLHDLRPRVDAKRRRSLSYCSDALRCADAAASSRSSDDRTAWSALRTSSSITCSSRWRCRAICSAAISARATFAFAVRLPNGSSTWSCTSAVGKRRANRLLSDAP
jgi:hypothetical protein